MTTAFDVTLGRTVTVKEIRNGQVCRSGEFICNEQCNTKLTPCGCTPGRTYNVTAYFRTSKGAIHSNECSYIKKTTASATGSSEQSSGLIDDRKVVITFGEKPKKSKIITSRVDNNLPKTDSIRGTNGADSVRKCERTLEYKFKEICNDFLAGKLDVRLNDRVMELIKEHVDICKSKDCIIFYGKCKTLITTIEEGKDRYISFYLNDNQFAFSIVKESEMSDDEFERIFNKDFQYKRQVFIGISNFEYGWNDKIKKFCLKSSLPIDRVYCPAK